MKQVKAFTRKTFWLQFVGSYIGVAVVVFMLEFVVGSDVARFFYLPLIPFWIYIEIKRFHDANKSGLFALLNLIPMVGFIVAPIVAGVMKSDYVNNKWYPNGAPVEENETLSTEVAASDAAPNAASTINIETEQK